MSLTDRDRKIVMLLVPAIVVLAYWFLLLTPQREEAATAATELSAQEQRRDAAQQRVDQLTAARSDFAADYAELVRLGKAVPATIDMPTLLVQLESAAGGTDISFVSIAAEARIPAAVPTATDPAAPGTGDGSQPAAAGGEPAASAPGTAAEAAGDAATGANASSAAAEQSGLDESDTATSDQVRDGALPVGGGTAATGTDPAAAGVAGLDTVPLTFEFTGDFFDLAAFFHRVKRYVEMSEDALHVRGRLLTIDGIQFTASADSFPEISATLEATAYLAPKAEGATAGATPGGPAATPVADPAAAPATAPPTPTATATP
ncbi:MAG: hypothetical protein WD993_02250 [Thermoleophilaceae bacterium]